MPDYSAEDTIFMLANLHLANNEIKTFRVQNVDDGTVLGEDLLPGAGRLVFFEDHLWLHDGIQWVQVGDSVILQLYQTRDEKDQPNGYAGLDANGEVAIEFLPTGNYDGKLPLLKGEIRDGQSIRFSEEDGGFVAFEVSTLYTYKGTCSSAELDLVTDQNVGDVWNLTDDRVWQGHNYIAGTSWAWEGTEWEPLAGSLDLSGYQLISNMVSNLSSPDSSTYPSTIAVTDYVRAQKTPVITQWGSESDASVPSSKLIKDSLDRKTDITMAIPAWSAEETYTTGSTATRGQALYISVQPDNIGHDPLTDTASDWWIPIQTEADLAVGSVRTVTHLIGNDTDTSYEIYHGFNSWNVFVSARTNAEPSLLVDARVEVIDPNQITVSFTNPPGETGYMVTVMAVTGASGGDTMVYTQSEASTEWNINHNWGTWCIVQTYDSEGDQMMADVVQSQDLNSIKISFGSAKTGAAILISGGGFDNTSTISGTGRARTVSLGAARMVRLNEASGTWVIQHDKGRLVVVQIYDESGNEIKADVIQDMATLNSVTIRFSRAVSGTAVIV